MDILNDVTKKSWSRKDVTHYQRILYRGEVKRSAFSKALSVINKVLILGVLMFGNIVIVFELFPLIIIADELFTSFFLITFGVLFGLFSDMIVYHLEKVSRAYYILVAALSPVVLLSTYAIARFGIDFWPDLFDLALPPVGPWFIAITYTVSFFLPFFYQVYRRHRAEQYFLKFGSRV